MTERRDKLSLILFSTVACAVIAMVLFSFSSLTIEERMALVGVMAFEAVFMVYWVYRTPKARAES